LIHVFHARTIFEKKKFEDECPRLVSVSLFLVVHDCHCQFFTQHNTTQDKTSNNNNNNVHVFLLPGIRNGDASAAMAWSE
jgi:hypothetical protein